MPTYLDRVKTERQRNNDLYVRMDADKNLLYLSRFVMTGRDGVSPVPNIRNSTMNDTAVFFANVVSNLGASVEQRVVESDDDKFDTKYVEDVLAAGFDAAALKRSFRGEWQLNPFTDEKSCIRGRVGARILFQLDEDGVLDTDITPWDMRFVTYVKGIKGLDWAANTTNKTKDEIEAEPWVEKSEGLIAALKSKDGTTNLIEVVDVWDTVHTEIWVNSQKVFTQPHTFGFTPVSIQVVPLGSMLADKDSLAHQGESIFFLFRDLVKELNELASIAKTLNFKNVEGALQLATDDGDRKVIPPGHHDKATSPGTINAIEKGGGYSNMPIQDIMRAYGQFMQVVESRIQRGSLSSIDLGIMPGQPPSAIALIQISEGRDQVFLPRLGVRGLLNQDLSYMMIEQLKQIGGMVELGARGHKQTWDTRKLEGEYDITYKYFIKDTKTDVARFSVAGVAEKYYDRVTVLSDVLQNEDPIGTHNKKTIEEAEDIFPIIKQARTIRTLFDSDNPNDQADAELAELSMGVSLTQLESGVLPQPAEIGQKPQPLPLQLGVGGEQSSAKRASDLQRTPAGEEGGE